MAQVNLTLDSDILNGLFTAEGKDEAFAGLVSTILNQVLSVQAREQVRQGSKSGLGRTSAAKTGRTTAMDPGRGH